MYLNDLNGVTWTDTILMPMLQEAHGELVQELDLNNTGTLKVQSSPITIAIGETDLGNNQPSNIINPISIMEGNVGDDPSLFLGMVKLDFVPNLIGSPWLTYWSWVGERVKFPPAIMARDVILRYEGRVATPEKLTDPLGIIFAEQFIGARIASLAHATITGQDHPRIQNIADECLNKIVRNQVVNDQRPKRRRPYRSLKGTYYINGQVSIPVGSGSGGILSTINNDTPSGVMDGVNPTFVLAYTPNPAASLVLTRNGQVMIVGQAYTLAGRVITFLAGFIPQADDVIRAWYQFA